VWILWGLQIPNKDNTGLYVIFTFFKVLSSHCIEGLGETGVNFIRIYGFLVKMWNKCFSNNNKKANNLTANLGTNWIYIMGFFLWRCDPTRVMAFSFLRFLDHTQRRTTVGRTPLDERSARRIDLHLTTHDTHNRQISIPRWNLNPRSQQASGRRPTP
jgi:hypothetical protein